MSKKRKSQKTQKRSSRDDDKPDYAMDKMLPVVEKVEKEVPREQQMVLEDRVNRNVLDRLSRLKTQMVEAQEQKPAGGTNSKQSNGKQPVNSVRNGGELGAKQADVRNGENPEPSFAELFDPSPEDEKSFEDLMKDSKLDWRVFK